MRIKSKLLCTDALKRISGESSQIKVDVRHSPGSHGDIRKPKVLECGKMSHKKVKSSKKKSVSPLKKKKALQKCADSCFCVKLGHQNYWTLLLRGR